MQSTTLVIPNVNCFNVLALAASHTVLDLDKQIVIVGGNYVLGLRRSIWGPPLRCLDRVGQT